MNDGLLIDECWRLFYRVRKRLRASRSDYTRSLVPEVERMLRRLGDVQYAMAIGVCKQAVASGRAKPDARKQTRAPRAGKPHPRTSHKSTSMGRG
jgi:hypothetical protein